jgi:hypothetical protein
VGVTVIDNMSTEGVRRMRLRPWLSTAVRPRLRWQEEHTPAGGAL